VRISKIVDHLRAAGEEILDTDLARVSPLCFAHIIHAYDSYRQMREAIEKFDRAIDSFVKVKKTRKRTILSTAATPEPSYRKRYEQRVSLSAAIATEAR
jgi:hypothetical protein